MQSERYITRCAYKSAKGWYVRVQQHAKFFSDSCYGGETSALTTARQHRDHICTILDFPLQGPMHRQVRGNVFLTRQTKKGTEYHSYTAAIWDRATRKQRKKSYSVIKWTTTGAKRRADNVLSDWRKELCLK